MLAVVFTVAVAPVTMAALTDPVVQPKLVSGIAVAKFTV
jgi:hypothetical protein